MTSRVNSLDCCPCCACCASTCVGSGGTACCCCCCAAWPGPKRLLPAGCGATTGPDADCGEVASPSGASASAAACRAMRSSALLLSSLSASRLRLSSLRMDLASLRTSTPGVPKEEINWQVRSRFRTVVATGCGGRDRAGSGTAFSATAAVLGCCTTRHAQCSPQTAPPTPLTRGQRRQRVVGWALAHGQRAHGAG